MMLGSFHNGIMVVVVDRLAVVTFTKGNDGSHIAAFHGIIAVLVHQSVSLLHPTLVIHCRCRTFVVHDEADAFLVCIFVQSRQIKVGIRCEEVEDELLLLAVPVLPANVPTFDEEAIEAVGGGKVDVAAHISVVGAVGAIGLGVFVVGLAEFHRGKVVGVGPGTLARNHLPPNAHVFHRVYP